MPLPDDGVVVFDLDDTLYAERDFVHSGFRAVANLLESETGPGVYERLVELYDSGERDPFATVLAERGLSPDKRRLIRAYRDHRPTLSLAPGVVRLLQELRGSGRILGIITDGRSVTQRNKISALGLSEWFDELVISEEFGSAKPEERNYRYFETRFPGRQFVYVGNDLAKDFKAPNHLGWLTVGVLERMMGLEKFDEEWIPDDILPRYLVERLA